MITWIVKMLLFWHYQKLYQLDLGVKISYDILTPPPPPRYFQPPQIIDDKVFLHFIFTKKKSLYYNYINDFLNS